MFKRREMNPSQITYLERRVNDIYWRHIETLRRSYEAEMPVPNSFPIVSDHVAVPHRDTVMVSLFPAERVFNEISYGEARFTPGAYYIDATTVSWPGKDVELEQAMDKIAGAIARFNVVRDQLFALKTKTLDRVILGEDVMGAITQFENWTPQ